MNRIAVVLVTATASVAGLAHRACAAAPTVLGVRWHADKPFPRFEQFWSERGDEVTEDGEPRTILPAPRGPLGGSVHVYFRNDGPTPLVIDDVLLADMSLKQCIALSDAGKKRDPASIYLAGLPKDKLDRLIAVGEPVWWKVDPAVVAPGGVGSVGVRLRTAPKTDAVKLRLTHASGTTEAIIPITSPLPAIYSVSFAPSLDGMYVYFRETPGAGRGPARIRLDGRDVTDEATTAHDSNLGLSLAVVRLAAPLKQGEYHCVQGVYTSTETASVGVRAWADEFAYGVWGGMPGEGAEVGRRYLEDLVAHNINVQMPQVGSAAVQAFFTSEAGRQFLAANSFRAVMNDPGKWGVENPFLLFVRDEPDCADYRVTGIPESKKIGSIAQWCIRRGHELRQAAPHILQMLNLDMTYKPHNWYTYGQVPDVFCVDPYYQARLRTAFWEHRERIPLYSKATYVYGVAAVAQSACEPNPLHTILYSCDWFTSDPARPRFRFPTPEEKRIEAYYAVGAGTKGLSYWWYTPATKPREAKRGVSCGVGAAHRGDRGAQALWREIGLLGAELRTAGPLLLRGAPAELAVKATSGLWIRCLLSGPDSIVLVVVNDQYRNDDKGTTYTPVENAVATVTLPAWLKAGHVFEIAASGVRPLKANVARETVTLPLGKVDLSRLIVVTSDADLSEQLTTLYTQQFAARTRRLLSN